MKDAEFYKWLKDNDLYYEYFNGGFYDMLKLWKSFESQTHVCEEKTVNIRWYHKGKLEPKDV